MSGTELMEEIEEVTGWRPSPGSIYPLLNRLSEEGFIEPVESEVPGLKPFALTEKGGEELERYKKRGTMFFADRYHSIRRIYWKIIKEMDEDLYQASSRLFDVIEEINSSLKEKSEASDRVKTILEKTLEEIEEVKRQLEEG